MRVPWIKVHAKLIDRPVVTRLADATRISRHEAVGVLVTFWSAVAEHATGGVVAPYSDTQLEAWARWPRKRGAFAEWVRACHLDDDGRVREWSEYQERLELERERNRAYQAEWRQRQRERLLRKANGEPNTKPHVSLTSNATVRYGTERYGTGEDQKPKSGGARATNPPWVDDAVQLWRHHVGHTTPAKMRRALSALVAEHDWPCVRAALEVYASPDEGPPPDKPKKPEWFAENFHRWRTVAETPLDDGAGALTERGRRLLARASA